MDLNRFSKIELHSVNAAKPENILFRDRIETTVLFYLHRHVGLSIIYTFIMETNCLLRHNIIKDRIAMNPEKVVDVAIRLWEQMATEIISIVGESGFNSLYSRSIFLTQSKFPWVGTSLKPPLTDQRFAELKIDFEGQTPAQASEANCLLLITFTDILASLIGEQLTTTILSSAWGNNASGKISKEFQNE